MFLPRVVVAAAIISIQLAMPGSTWAAPPPMPAMPAIDPKQSPSRDTAPRLSSAAAEGIHSPAPKQKEAEQDNPERLRQRLADALAAAADGKTASAASSPQTLQIVNRREPTVSRGSVNVVAPPNRVAIRQPESVANSPARQGPHAQVPKSTVRLVEEHRRQAAHDHAGEGLAIVPGTAGGSMHWTYDGPTGPQAWADLRADFATCASGQRQSPIDIRDGLKLQLEPIVFSYVPSKIRVVDTGHTVQVNVGAGNWIEVMGRRFELQQFHFHKPSEERIDGRRFDMGAHLVHRDLDGRLAVVAVLLSRGTTQQLIQTVWNNLPLEKGSDQPVSAPIDLNALLPVARGYAAYMGSLTTPPCTEDVLWLVMKSPVEISAQQIAIFDRLYPMNARPIQAIAGRMIKESD